MTSLHIVLFILFAILILALFINPQLPSWSSSTCDVDDHEGFGGSLSKENAEHVDKQQPVDVIATLPTTSKHDCLSNGLVSSEGGAVCLSSGAVNLIKSRGGNYS